jgi:hypothetical protein
VSDAWVGSLLSAVGNSEAKALLLSAMSRNIIYSGRDLYRLMRDKQGSRVSWRQNPLTPLAHCEYALYPVGLVEKVVLDSDRSAYGYVKTQCGREVGDALAGHLLLFSERHSHISLLQIFGSMNAWSTSSSPDYGDRTLADRSRAQIRRYKVLCALLHMEMPVREIDLAVSLQEDRRVILSHLRALAQRGIII